MPRSFVNLHCRNPTGFHRVSATVWGQGNAGRPLVCAHGFSRNSRDFDVLASALAVDRPVYCPDAVGRGRSGWLSDRNHYGYEQYARDAATLISHVSAWQDGDEPGSVDWVGTSMGGMVGMMLAAQPNTPIRRLVLNDIGPRIPATALNAIGEYMRQTLVFADLDDYQTWLSTIHAGFGHLTNTQWQHMARHSHRKDDAGRIVPHYDPKIASAFDQIYTEDVEVWDTWQAIKVPTLVLRGEQSELLTTDTVNAMVAMRPDTQVVEIEGAGHAPGLMSAHEIEVVRRFLAKQPRVNNKGS